MKKSVQQWLRRLDDFFEKIDGVLSKKLRDNDELVESLRLSFLGGAHPSLLVDSVKGLLIRDDPELLDESDYLFSAREFDLVRQWLVSSGAQASSDLLARIKSAEVMQQCAAETYFRSRTQNRQAQDSLQRFSLETVFPKSMPLIYDKRNAYDQEYGQCRLDQSNNLANPIGHIIVDVPVVILCDAGVFYVDSDEPVTEAQRLDVDAARFLVAFEDHAGPFLTPSDCQQFEQLSGFKIPTQRFQCLSQTERVAENSRVMVSYLHSTKIKQSFDVGQLAPAWSIESLTQAQSVIDLLMVAKQFDFDTAAMNAYMASTLHDEAYPHDLYRLNPDVWPRTSFESIVTVARLVVLLKPMSTELLTALNALEADQVVALSEKLNVCHAAIAGIRQNFQGNNDLFGLAILTWGQDRLKKRLVLQTLNQPLEPTFDPDTIASDWFLLQQMRLEARESEVFDIEAMEHALLNRLRDGLQDSSFVNKLPLNSWPELIDSVFGRYPATQNQLSTQESLYDGLFVNSTSLSDFITLESLDGSVMANRLMELRQACQNESRKSKAKQYFDEALDDPTSEAAAVLLQPKVAKYILDYCTQEELIHLLTKLGSLEKCRAIFLRDQGKELLAAFNAACVKHQLKSDFQKILRPWFSKMLNELEQSDVTAESKFIVSREVLVLMSPADNINFDDKRAHDNFFNANIKQVFSSKASIDSFLKRLATQFTQFEDGMLSLLAWCGNDMALQRVLYKEIERLAIDPQYETVAKAFIRDRLSDIKKLMDFADTVSKLATIGPDDIAPLFQKYRSDNLSKAQLLSRLSMEFELALASYKQDSTISPSVLLHIDTLTFFSKQLTDENVSETEVYYRVLNDLLNNQHCFDHFLVCHDGDDQKTKSCIDKLWSLCNGDPSLQDLMKQRLFDAKNLSPGVSAYAYAFYMPERLVEQAKENHVVVKQIFESSYYYREYLRAHAFKRLSAIEPLTVTDSTLRESFVAAVVEVIKAHFSAKNDAGMLTVQQIFSLLNWLTVEEKQHQVEDILSSIFDSPESCSRFLGENNILATPGARLNALRKWLGDDSQEKHLRSNMLSAINDHVDAIKAIDDRVNAVEDVADREGVDAAENNVDKELEQRSRKRFEKNNKILIDDLIRNDFQHGTVEDMLYFWSLCKTSSHESLLKLKIKPRFDEAYGRFERNERLSIFDLELLIFGAEHFFKTRIFSFQQSKEFIIQLIERIFKFNEYQDDIRKDGDRLCLKLGRLCKFDPVLLALFKEKIERLISAENPGEEFNSAEKVQWDIRQAFNACESVAELKSNLASIWASCHLPALQLAFKKAISSYRQGALLVRLNINNERFAEEDITVSDYLLDDCPEEWLSRDDQISLVESVFEQLFTKTESFYGLIESRAHDAEQLIQCLNLLDTWCQYFDSCRQKLQALLGNLLLEAIRTINAESNPLVKVLFSKEVSACIDRIVGEPGYDTVVDVVSKYLNEHLKDVESFSRFLTCQDDDRTPLQRIAHLQACCRGNEDLSNSLRGKMAGLLKAPAIQDIVTQALLADPDDLLSYLASIGQDVGSLQQDLTDLAGWFNNKDLKVAFRAQLLQCMALLQGFTNGQSERLLSGIKHFLFVTITKSPAELEAFLTMPMVDNPSAIDRLQKILPVIGDTASLTHALATIAKCFFALEAASLHSLLLTDKALASAIMQPNFVLADSSALQAFLRWQLAKKPSVSVATSVSALAIQCPQEFAAFLAKNPIGHLNAIVKAAGSDAAAVKNVKHVIAELFFADVNRSPARQVFPVLQQPKIAAHLLTHVLNDDLRTLGLRQKEVRIDNWVVEAGVDTWARKITNKASAKHLPVQAIPSVIAAQAFQSLREQVFNALDQYKSSSWFKSRDRVKECDDLHARVEAITAMPISEVMKIRLLTDAIQKSLANIDNEDKKTDRSWSVWSRGTTGGRLGSALQTVLSEVNSVSAIVDRSQPHAIDRQKASVAADDKVLAWPAYDGLMNAMRNFEKTHKASPALIQLKQQLQVLNDSSMSLEDKNKFGLDILAKMNRALLKKDYTTNASHHWFQFVSDPIRTLLSSMVAQLARETTDRLPQQIIADQLSFLVKNMEALQANGKCKHFSESLIQTIQSLALAIPSRQDSAPLELSGINESLNVIKFSMSKLEDLTPSERVIISMVEEAQSYCGVFTPQSEVIEGFESVGPVDQPNGPAQYSLLLQHEDIQGEQSRVPVDARSLENFQGQLSIDSSVLLGPHGDDVEVTENDDASVSSNDGRLTVVQPGTPERGSGYFSQKSSPGGSPPPELDLDPAAMGDYRKAPNNSVESGLLGQGYGFDRLSDEQLRSPLSPALTVGGKDN